MRKLMIMLFGLLLTVFFVFPAVAADDVVELNMWTHQRHMMEVVEELNEEFNNTVGKEKGIKVELRVVGDDHEQLWQAAQKNDRGPDLFNTATGYNGFEAEYEAGAKIYFDDLPGFEEWKEQWPDWYWQEGLTTWNGHVYALPWNVNNARIIYNKDLFEEAGIEPAEQPWSYEQVREYAKQITENVPDKYGFAYPGKENWFTEWMPGQLAEANGTSAWFDWSTGTFDMNGYYDFFKLLLDMYKDGSMFPGPTSLANDPLRAQFAAGNVGMFMGEAWDVGVLNDQFPAECDWGVAVAPTISGEFEGRSRAMLTEGIWSINGQS
ncbi:MAG: ABC transporter substrate-binding protein, partial [Halanaerobiaceae bacterium]